MTGENIVSFGNEVMLCGTFDVNGNGTYESATDHRYRFYGGTGAPENSGVIAASGERTWATRRGANAHAWCARQASMTKITTGGTVTVVAISGVGETPSNWRDVKEDSNGNVLILSNSTVYSFPPAGGSANWTVSLSNRRRLECDASGNIYVCGGDLKKYNSSGSLLWTFATPPLEFAAHLPVDQFGIYRHTSLHLDVDGYAYVTGSRIG